MNFIIIAKVKVFNNSWQLAINLNKMVKEKKKQNHYGKDKKHVESQVISKNLLGRSYYMYSVLVE